MNRITSLAWKEWHETRPLLWIGLGVFFGLPIIGALEATLLMHKRFELFASQWVFDLGAVLAVFVAVNITCRDLETRLQDFWRSRPIRLSVFFAVKYIVGLAVVLLACVPPLAAELLFNRSKMPAANAIIWMPFFLAACYSLGFAAGCIIRRMAHAAVVALAGVLLLYLLPVVLPPLQSFSMDAVAEVRLPHVWTAPLGIFAGGMLIVAAALAIAAVMAVRRQWHAEAGPRTMYAAIASVLLLLLVVANYQVGTNLPVLAQANLNLLPDEHVVGVGWNGSSGLVASMLTVATRVGVDPQVHWYLRTVRTSGRDLLLSGPERCDDERVISLWDLGGPGVRDSEEGISNPLPEYPGMRYFVAQDFDESAKSVAWNLRMFDYAPNDTAWKTFVMPLWKEPLREAFTPVLHAWQNRLYVATRQRLAVFDITKPLQPKVISSRTVPPLFHEPILMSDGLTISLPEIPLITDTQRLQLAIDELLLDQAHGQPFGGKAFDGKFLCIAAKNDGIDAYQLTAFTHNSARFHKVGEYHQAMLEALFGPLNYGSLKLQNGRLYVGGWGDRGMFNAHITVFDLNDKYPLRPVGHFGAPGAVTVCPLPGGRALIGGSHLWLVGPPPQRG